MSLTPLIITIIRFKCRPCRTPRPRPRRSLLPRAVARARSGFVFATARLPRPSPWLRGSLRRGAGVVSLCVRLGSASPPASQLKPPAPLPRSCSPRSLDALHCIRQSSPNERAALRTSAIMPIGRGVRRRAACSGQTLVRILTTPKKSDPLYFA